MCYALIYLAAKARHALNPDLGRAPEGELHLDDALCTADRRLARARVTQRALKGAVPTIAKYQYSSDSA